MEAVVPTQPSNSVSTPRAVGFAALVLVIALVAGWWGMKRLLWFTPTGHAVAHVVTRAVNVDDLILVPPEARQDLPMTPAQVLAYRRQAQSLLSHVYTGRVLVMWEGIARKTLDPRSLHHGKNPSWAAPWSTDRIHFDELSIGLNGATATASVQYHNQYAVNRVDYTDHLVRTKTGWRIDQERFQFEPGYSP